ncbi:hypothetical protein DFH09DRAFT_944726 [Mycena vulgaris]|nr:hypothetical protein DFH09DRAFT_944726 [Mycena vulgaris]
MVTTLKLDEVPDILYLSIEDPGINLAPAIHIGVSENRHRFALRGIIYAGNNHFTSRIIKEDGSVWYHDGISTGNKCEYCTSL